MLVEGKFRTYYAVRSHDAYISYPIQFWAFRLPSYMIIFQSPPALYKIPWMIFVLQDMCIDRKPRRSGASRLMRALNAAGRFSGVTLLSPSVSYMRLRL